MSWKDLKIGKKLAIGFGSLLVLVSIAGLVGYDGIVTVNEGLIRVGDEEAPIADMAMEMTIALLTAGDAMAEFTINSSALATDDASVLTSIERTYQQSVQDFDRYAQAIVSGATLPDGSVVIKTDNPELASLVGEAQILHDNEFQPAAVAMMNAGRGLLERKEARTRSMLEMERVYDEAYVVASKLEDNIADQMDSVTGEGAGLLRQVAEHSHIANELKISLAQSRLQLEEYPQTLDRGELAEVERVYREWIEQFDRDVGVILHGGELDGRPVVAMRDSVNRGRRGHGEAGRR